MGMNVGSADDGGEDQVVSSINTTPLVDVMLVLLIIFLITIPVVTHTAPVNLPKETNIPTETRPENIIIAVTQEGDMYWGTEKLADANALVERLKEKAVLKPQPELHIRGDRDARYEFVGRVVVAAQRAGIVKVGFISEPATGVGTVKRVGQ
jgi:biopolymer transport protein ExbD